MSGAASPARGRSRRVRRALPLRGTGCWCSRFIALDPALPRRAACGLVPWAVPLSGFFFAALQPGSAGMARTAGIPHRARAAPAGLHPPVSWPAGWRWSILPAPAPGGAADRPCRPARPALLRSIPRFLPPSSWRRWAVRCAPRPASSHGPRGLRLSPEPSARWSAPFFFRLTLDGGALRRWRAASVLGADLRRVSPAPARRSDRRVDRHQHPGGGADDLPAECPVRHFGRVPRSRHSRLRDDPYPDHPRHPGHRANSSAASRSSIICRWWLRC